MSRQWREAKELFDETNALKDKLKIFLEDIWEFNNIDNESEKINLFIGEYKGGFVRNIETIFGKSLENPYNNKSLSALTRNRGIRDDENVIFTTIPGKASREHELLATKEIRTFEELNITSSLSSEILRKVVDSKLGRTYEKQLSELIVSNDWPIDFNEFLEKKTNLIKEKNEIEQRINELNIEIDGKRDIRNEIEIQLKEMQKQYDDLKKKTSREIERIKYISAMSDDTSVIAEPIGYSEQLLQIIKSRLEYKYSDDLLIPFLMALGTNQIITLFGKPGTGKTSFAINISKALGAKYTIISVQNNWTDSTDILGYYNPVDKTYISTPFLDALLDAKNDERRWIERDVPSPLHIICLDEMNLARIEYYFAEFLSKLQISNERKDGLIHLIPSDIQNEIKELKKKHNEYTKDEKKLLSLEKYTNFAIPQNVRFIGTINNDDTTNAISPKVIDRSFYLEMQYTEIDKNENYSQDSKFIPEDFFKTEPFPNKFRIFATENYRFKKYVQEMWPIYKRLVADGDEELFCSYVIIGKILPALRTVNDYSYKSFKKAYDVFKKHMYNESDDEYNYLGG